MKIIKSFCNLSHWELDNASFWGQAADEIGTVFRNAVSHFKYLYQESQELLSREAMD